MYLINILNVKVNKIISKYNISNNLGYIFIVLH